MRHNLCANIIGLNDKYNDETKSKMLPNVDTLSDRYQMFMINRNVRRLLFTFFSTNMILKT
jgi:hypothetical protein